MAHLQAMPLPPAERQGRASPADPPRRPVLGILGGMGPLASTEFLRTIYEHAAWEREQDAPAVVLASDPAFPDRTEAFLAGRDEAVLGPTVAALRGLVAMGADALVMCCMTAHHLLPRLPADLRGRTVSLLDEAFAGMAEAEGPHLLLCTRGTRAVGLFERHPAWEGARGRVRLLSAGDQARVHDELIYRIKRNVPLAALAPFLADLLERYGVRSFVVGCSEVHLLAKHVLRTPEGRGFAAVDPLDRVARTWANAARQKEA